MRITLDDSEVKQPETKTRRSAKVKKVRNKKDLTNTQKAVRIIFGIIGVLVVIGISYVGYLGYKTFKTGQAIGLKFKPNDIIAQEVPELKKDSSGKYTNVLVIGIDTRDGSQLLNTDSIILVSYNHETSKVVMTSLPRDLHVQVNPEVFWFNRINSVYATFESKGEGLGLERLKDVVTEVTGQEIQYHAMINYHGFVELIDALGGIDVNVENSFTDYMYPSEPGYKTVSFTEGPQHMDGSTALEYARSRHSMHNGEGSDFARARRQQNVISAVTGKVMDGSLLDPKALMNLFNVVQDNIQISEFTITDIEAGITILGNFKEDGEINSFVLDPNAGAGKLITSKNVVNTGAYAIGPILGLGNYTNIQEYIDYILEDPSLYEENPIIKIYNTGLGYAESSQYYYDMVEQFPYLKIGYMGTLYSDKEGISTYINSDDKTEFTKSLSSLNKYIQSDSTEKPEYIKTRLNAEDITILLGGEIVEITETTNTEE